MKSIHLISLLCIVIVFSSWRLITHEGDVEQAKTYFDNNEYEKALSTWKVMVDEQSNAGLYFNIGLAESKLKHSALAIYAFEQALRIRPSNTTYLHALKAERENVDNAVAPIDTFFLDRWYLAIISIFRPGIWSLLALALFVGALLAWLSRLRVIPVKPVIPQRRIKWMGLAGGILLLIAVLRYSNLNQHDEAIVMNRCELHQASTPESPVLKSVSAGEKVRIKDQIGSWYYVALLNLDYGWIPMECCKPISFP